MGFWGFITTAALVVSLATKIQDAKEMAGLAFSIVTGGGEDAACKLCDKMVNVIVKEVELDDATNEGELQCNHLCLGFGRCVPTCERILKAMTSSTGFPCVAAGICPEVDDWGDVSCRFVPRFGCEPNQCSYKFPRAAAGAQVEVWPDGVKLNDLQSGLRSRRSAREGRRLLLHPRGRHDDGVARLLGNICCPLSSASRRQCAIETPAPTTGSG